MIALGCDHGGYVLMQSIMEHLNEKGVEFKDFGCFECAPIDYPVVAKQVCNSVIKDECELGILVCGTGIGMSMAANKVKGIRAAACSETFSARFTRMHNNANILCLGGRVVGPGTACDMVDLFLNTPFEGGRHQKRVDLITQLEQE